jgi:dihydrofolate synthase/folylpolyglutamate synthase
VQLDHQEYLGSTRDEIALEKVGIVKPGAIAVLGETDPEITALLSSEASRLGAESIWRRDTDFSCDVNRLALAGRLVTLRTPSSIYEDVFVPLHGRHQGDNAAVALASVEAFVGVPLAEKVVRRGFGAVVNPGRMEIVGRRPLLLLDGAHNPAGARAAAVTLNEEFAAVQRRVLVVGLLGGRDPAAMLDALEVERAALVIAVAPSSSRALDPERIVEAAAARGVPARGAASVEQALRIALDNVTATDLCLVTGSLYLVGDARKTLRRLVV